MGHTRDARTGQYTANGSLNNILARIGVLVTKHIPREYLEASVTSVGALLEGLMDTDGYVDTLGRCDITTIDRGLAEQYAEPSRASGTVPHRDQRPPPSTQGLRPAHGGDVHATRDRLPTPRANARASS